MVDSETINDANSFKRWLALDKPHRDPCIALGHRIAMRVAPLYWIWARPTEIEAEFAALPLQRSLFFSGLAARDLTSEIRSAAKAAGTPVIGGNHVSNDAAEAATRAIFIANTHKEDADEMALHAFKCATHAASAADLSVGPARESRTVVAALWSALNEDCSRLRPASELLSAPLWPSQSPWEQKWDKVSTAWNSAGPEWKFWIDWYENALTGKPHNWDLYRRIALELTPDDWDQGSNHVNALIIPKWRGVGAQQSPMAPQILEIDGAEAAARSLDFAQVPSQKVQRGMQENREVLPPTLDAIEGLLILEMQSLQESNSLNAEAPEAVKRMITTLRTAYAAIQGLKRNLPSNEAVSIEQAEASKGFLKPFFKSVRDLQEDKAKQAGEYFWETSGRVTQCALVFGAVSMATRYGWQGAFAIPLAAFVFAPGQVKNIVGDFLPLDESK